MFHLYTIFFEDSLNQVLQMSVSNADAAAIAKRRFCLLKKHTAGDMEQLEMISLLVQVQPNRPNDTNAQFPIITMGDVSSLCGEHRVDMGLC